MRCVRTRAEQFQILATYHLNPTAGHMGERRMIKRIGERYMWRGIVKDVQEISNYTYKYCDLHGNVTIYNIYDALTYMISLRSNFSNRSLNTHYKPSPIMCD